MNAAAVDRGQALGGPRVLIIAPQTEWIYQNLTPSFRRLCSAVYAIPVGNSMGNSEIPNWRAMRAKIWDRVMSDVRSLTRGQGIDLIVSMLYDDAITREQAQQLRSLGVPIVQYHVDMNEQWYRVLRHIDKLDLLVVSHMQHLEPIMRKGVQIHYMPMGASPDRYTPDAKSTAPACEVLFLGSPNSARLEAVASAVQSGETIDVVGRGWDKYLERIGKTLGQQSGRATMTHPTNKFHRRMDNLHYVVPCVLADGSWFFNKFRSRISTDLSALLPQTRRANFRGSATDADIPNLLSRAKIILGVNQRSGKVGDRFGVADSRLRDFEATLSGGLYLVQNYPDLSAFYRPGHEVETWSSLNELVEKIRYLMPRRELRERIARAGYERCIRDHTWDVRLDSLLRVMGLRPREPHAELLRTEMAPLYVLNNYGREAWGVDWPGCRPTDSALAGDKPLIDELLRG
jgi:spore maturation protein CgeB